VEISPRMAEAGVVRITKATYPKGKKEKREKSKESPARTSEWGWATTAGKAHLQKFKKLPSAGTGFSSTPPENERGKIGDHCLNEKQ